jgi:hydrogenase maturation protease
MRTLVLGLGNPILRDDAVGLRVAQAVAAALERRQDIEVGEDHHGGLRLMERMIGYDRAILVDAIVSGARPGTVHHLTPQDSSTARTCSSHGVNLPSALAVGYRAGAHLPAMEDVHIVAIEAQDVLTFGEDLTPEVAAAVPRAVRAVLDWVNDQEASAPHLPGG